MRVAIVTPEACAGPAFHGCALASGSLNAVPAASVWPRATTPPCSSTQWTTTGTPAALPIASVSGSTAPVTVTFPPRTVSGLSN